MQANRIKYYVLGCIASLTFVLPSHAEPTQEAKAYLDQALELIRLHHRNSAKSDWPKISAQARSNIDNANAKVPKDTWFAIYLVLQALGERHSFLIPPTGSDAQAEMEQRDPAPVLMPSWKLESRRYGVLTLPGLLTFDDTDGKKASQYHMTARDGLMQMDKSNICGWVIDLRENDGGNMWPMLWGLDPLLGPSPFGAFPEGASKKQDWVRANGYIHATSEPVIETPPSFQLKHANAPVAVLVGPNTGSSGEMTAIAFIGRNKARLFGTPTAGLTSANKTFMMSDGLGLVLTSSSSADRLGREYTGPIVPDEQVESDKAMSTAIKWLKKNC